jgi:dTDP-4-amino-4,6-dideoxygalactose transaminase
VLANHPEVVLIEDNAHGLFGAAGPRPLGTLGRMSTLSFHETKNFVCGEGGALILNDRSDVERAHILHDKGTNRRAFFLGQVDKYSWVDTGSSFGMSDLLAAFLFAQLEKRDEVLTRRKNLHETYAQVLMPVAADLGLQLPTIPADRTPGYHMYYLLLPDHATRNHVLSALRDHGIAATFHYVPLHNSDEGLRVSAAPADCPVTVDVSGRLLRLPFFNELDLGVARRVAETVIACLT